jgi:nitroreductase
MKAKTLEQKDIFKAIHRSQHCQRNWNLEDQMPQEDIEMILEAVTQCPSKQNKKFYKVHVLQDRDIIKRLHDQTNGFGISNELTTTNTQTLANLVLVFESARTANDVKYAYVNRRIIDPEFDVHNTDWVTYEFDQELLAECEEEMRRDEHMAVGVAAGYSNLTASLMGYGTGCCACFDPHGVKEVLNLDGECLLIMGIGIPGDKPRRVHHLDETITFPTKRKEEIPVSYA